MFCQLGSPKFQVSKEAPLNITVTVDNVWLKNLNYFFETPCISVSYFHFNLKMNLLKLYNRSVMESCKVGMQYLVLQL